MPAYLAKHIISPVHFTDELASLYRDGYTGYIELGPNKVLTGLVKKLLKSSRFSHRRPAKRWMQFSYKQHTQKGC